MGPVAPAAERLYLLPYPYRLVAYFGHIIGGSPKFSIAYWVSSGITSVISLACRLTSFPPRTSISSPKSRGYTEFQSEIPSAENPSRRRFAIFPLVHRFRPPNSGRMPDLSLKLRRRKIRRGVDLPIFRLVRQFHPRNSRACQFCTFEYHFYHAKLDRVLNLNPNSGCMPNLSLKLRRRIFRRGVDLPLFPLVHRFRL